MKKMKWLCMSFIIVLIFSLAACNSSNETTKTTTSGGGKKTNDNKTEEAGTVNIGYTGPLSGPAAFYGARTLNGLKMAAEEINGAGGFEVGGKK
jgi:branched-chain amino acid transport system substrate-binding protein